MNSFKAFFIICDQFKQMVNGNKNGWHRAKVLHCCYLSVQLVNRTRLTCLNELARCNLLAVCYYKKDFSVS